MKDNSDKQYCKECGKNETLEGYIMCERCIMFDCAMDMKKLGYNIIYIQGNERL